MVDIPPHGLIYASVPLTCKVACVTLYCPTAPLKPAISVSTITLFLIELLEALESENMERLLKDSSKN